MKSFIAKGSANGEINKAAINPKIAQITPKRKPITAKRIFIPISHINPSKLNSQMSPGKRMLLSPIKNITVLGALSSKNSEEVKAKTKIVVKISTTAKEGAIIKVRINHAVATPLATPRLTQSLVKE